MTTAFAQGSGACPSLRLPSDGSLDPLLGSLPTFSTNQGLGTRRYAPSHQGSGAPWCCPVGTALSNHFSDRITHGAWRKKINSSAASRGSGAFGSARQPLEPFSFATKKLPEGSPREACPSRHSLTPSVLEQSSRMMPKVFSAPRHRYSPHNAPQDPLGLRRM
jgi:hypothetical protein